MDTVLPPTTEPLDDFIEIDSSDEETMEELQELEDIEDSAKALEAATAQQKLSDDREAAEKQRKVKEAKWSNDEDEADAATDKAAQIDLVTTIDENKKKENGKNATQQKEKPMNKKTTKNHKITPAQNQQHRFSILPPTLVHVNNESLHTEQQLF